ncbi:hypothetical protein DPMN_166030 [Dreissena polymorpha]|uniref:Uncharacterized protein n=1 Tax=Dreissena polymorpha TaxID=45954 RepID=A0A9D4EW28_DREPO|nr:hypothetical protein DPMN_166030 [Dreissena polymorpha]
MGGYHSAFFFAGIAMVILNHKRTLNKILLESVYKQQHQKVIEDVHVMEIMDGQQCD